MNTATDHNPQTMQCMEVWGGNQATDASVVMAGLDAWVYCQPYHGQATGGDVHYVSSCATGRITRILVADVSGHGEAVAEPSTRLRNLMRQYINRVNQQKFVLAMNRSFLKLNDECNFATAIVIGFFAPTGSTTICNAGHPPPLLYRAGTKSWEFVNVSAGQQGVLSNLPLGVDAATRYEQEVVRMRTDDLLLCYTDSALEVKDEHGTVLGLEGLGAIVRTLEADEPETLIDSLRQKLKNNAASGAGEDDLTLLLLRPNGTTPRAPLSQRLKGMGIMVRNLIGQLIPGGRPMPWPELTVESLGGAFLAKLSRRGTPADRESS